ncbi:2-C-methyl-D-erythritol 4-phosphate cytidylyltransferase [Bacteroides sp. OttesenSCG-928-E20]|nr:2-C-methyl-D-erythritol 4-phosphate cytidylyltransferase [Bacteroides sp. OttesenSCG-928-E20]MDL2305044.1 2-C-methyl-D-erythritol 4-phosphate cytidylyltransferase [Bacteroides sp. OttesenSCG-928-D19]
MTKYALIVAGGKGLRMGSELPKQFLPIGTGQPVLMHTIRAFYTYDTDIHIILVLPQSQQTYWKHLCQEHGFDIPHSIANGGETRYHSVKNGLSFVQEPGVIGIHDGVRPLVSQDVISRCYALAQEHKAVVPVVDVVETVRQLQETSSRTVDRNLYKLVQTPQVFCSDLLLKAYEQEYKEAFTDDASVVEEMGIPVYLTSGNRENIKITTPFDLKIANALLECSI